MPNPTVYPGAKTFLSVGVEPAQGTAVTPTWTYPLESFDPADQPQFIDDTSMYGDMAALHGTQPGGVRTEFNLSGPYFGDGAGLLLHNILGDLSEDGTYSGSGTTTLSAPAAVGATTITTALSLTTGQVVAIGASTAKAEIRTLTSTGTSPTFAQPLVYAHAAAETVRPVTSPFTHVESLLNSGTAQPPSLTLIDWQGLTPTTQARAYLGCCLSELTLKGSAESEFVSLAAKGMGWPSAAAAALPTSAPTTAVPLAAWRTLLGIAGPASGGTQVKTVSEFEITISRVLKAEYTFQNSQSPYLIQRGAVRVSGKLKVPVPADESHLTYMLSNTQPQLQLVVSNGLSGASLLSLQVDIQKAAYKSAKVVKAEAMGYDVTFDAIANATNAGGSGGQSPIKVTTQNAVNQVYGF